MFTFFAHGIVLFVRYQVFQVGGSAALLRLFVVALPIAVATCTIDQTAHRLERHRWEFDGRSLAKYESEGRRFLVVDVLVEGHVRTYRNVGKEFWDLVAIGDHVQKAACDGYATVNGKRVVIVDGVTNSTDSIDSVTKERLGTLTLDR